jgi:hypothetical protein
MRNFGRKAAMATVAFATVGSTLFGGAALANGGHDGVDVTNTGGAGGAGGAATNNCLNVAIPIQALNIASTATQTTTQCSATGGAGGAGGAATLDG